jgi:hypothetical protein
MKELSLPNTIKKEKKMNEQFELALEGFETFDEVEHLPLRTYNRMVMCFNIKEDFGPVVLEEYVENFDIEERKRIFLLMAFVYKEGMERAREICLKGFVPEEEDLTEVEVIEVS